MDLSGVADGRRGGRPRGRRLRRRRAAGGDEAGGSGADGPGAGDGGADAGTSTHMVAVRGVGWRVNFSNFQGAFGGQIWDSAEILVDKIAETCVST